MASVEQRDPRMGAIISDRADFERLGTGFQFTEGPVWHHAGEFLLFSDMPGDHMRRWSAADGITTFRQPCNKSNGLAYDREGRLLVCEHATSRVTRIERSGGVTALASHFQDKELNSPNDIVCKSDGAIYFTDPTYGRMEGFGVKRDAVLGFQAVYRIGPDGSLMMLADDFGQPNGLCFSLDEKNLFINDTDRMHIREFHVAPDGTLRGGGVWAEIRGAEPGAPDGMKLDAAGNLYCTGPGGIHVFAPDATMLGRIRTPERAANFCFGDEDGQSLFVTASTSLYRIRLKMAGNPACVTTREETSP
jgi:gluconolactonase